MATNSHKSADRYIWHHRLHEEWGKERLFFWRLGFAPTYDRRAILRRLEAVFSENQIISYGVYESTGYHDLFLRIWLPTTITQDAFERVLYEKLSEEHLQICEPFVVSQIVADWIWQETPRGPMRAPSDEIVGRRLCDAEIERINKREFTEDEIRKYEQINLVSSWRPTEGVRFIISIPRCPHPLPARARDALTVRLYGILAESPHLKDLSLYAGGGFAQFLMMGAVDPRNFSSINDVIDQINTVGLQAFFEVRTYTHIVVNAAGRELPLQDVLPLSEEVAEEDALESYLSGEESGQLEFKGSAFVDIKRWVLGDGKLERSDKVVNEGVLKSIVGFLNARGGKLVVGILEARKFEKAKGAERLSDFPRYENYIVCGVNLDYGTKDADWFQLRLLDLMRERITPAPLSWVTVKLQKFGPRDVCIISVRQMISDHWFYLKDKDNSLFYVRQGNSTRHLSGPEADEYKRSNPR